MTANYLPWQIKLADFLKLPSGQAQLEFLIKFAVLAPSSHNSQPWKFQVSDRSIWVFANLERRLKDSDRNNRQMFLSLGCAITNILIAGDYLGLAGQVFLEPNSGDSTCAARLDFSLGEKKDKETNHLIFSIPRRVNNRHPYETQAPDTKTIASIKDLITADLNIKFISDKATKNKLAEIAVEAGIHAMTKRPFRMELARYLKSNLTGSPLGMPAFGMNIPTPASFFVPWAVRLANVNRLNKYSELKLLTKETPMLGIINTERDTPSAWLTAGQIYQKISLISCQNRLATAVWAAPVQISNYYQEIQKVLNTKFRPQFFFRIGYTKYATPHSPRLSADEVLSENNDSHFQH